VPERTEIWCVRAGVVPYRDALALQARLARARQAAALPDVLLLLEHPPTYTRGRRSTSDELPMGEDWYLSQGIEIHDTDRGGRVTYHGPGQLVGYPIVSLRPYGDDVHAYVRGLERVVIAALAAYGIEAGPNEELTGVWTAGGRKIGSIGVHVSRGVATHGFAVNVNNDLQPFEWIVPCGIEHCRMSSIARETRLEQDLPGFADVVCREFGRVYDRAPRDVDAGRLVERLAAAETAREAVPA
jgi:lipoyl(octanoyl) transferase